MRKASFSLSLIISANVLIILLCLSAGLHILPQPTFLKDFLQSGEKTAKEIVWILDKEVQQVKQSPQS